MQTAAHNALVAPRAGAWIETLKKGMKFIASPFFLIA